MALVVSSLVANVTLSSSFPSATSVTKSTFPISLSASVVGTTKTPSNYKIVDSSCVKVNRSDLFGIFDGVSVYRANLTESGMKVIHTILHSSEKKKFTTGSSSSVTGYSNDDGVTNNSSTMMTMNLASRVLIAEIGPLPTATNVSNTSNVLVSSWYDTLLLMTEVTTTARNRGIRSLLPVYGAYEYTIPGNNQRYLHVIMEAADGTIDRLAYPIDKILGTTNHETAHTTTPTNDVSTVGTNTTTTIPDSENTHSSAAGKATVIMNNSTGYIPGTNTLPVTLINSLNLPQRLTCLKDVTEALCCLHFDIRRLHLNKSASSSTLSSSFSPASFKHSSISHNASTVGISRRGSLDSNTTTTHGTIVTGTPLLPPNNTGQRRASIDSLVELKKTTGNHSIAYPVSTSIASPLSSPSSSVLTDPTYHHPDSRYPGEHVPITHGHLSPHYVFFDIISIGKYRYKLAFYLMHILRDQLMWVPPSKGNGALSILPPLSIHDYRRDESIDERNYFRRIEMFDKPNNNVNVSPTKSSKSLCYAEAVYAAPSVIHGIIPTAESDIYSLGMIGWSILQSIPAGKTSLPELGNRVPDYVRNIIKASMHPDEDMRLMAIELSTELTSALDALTSASFRSRFSMNPTNSTTSSSSANIPNVKGLSRHSYNEEGGSVRGGDDNIHTNGSSALLVRSNSSLFPRASSLPSLPPPPSLSTRSLTEDNYLPNNSISTIVSDGDGPKSVFRRASKDILGPLAAAMNGRIGKGLPSTVSYSPSLSHLPIPIPSYAGNASSTSSSRIQRSYDAPEADIVFLADSTGNMKKWIFALREAARELLRLPIRGHQARIGFIGYTDVDYPVHNRTGCEELTIDFTNDFNVLRNKLDSIPCTGGQDCAEDVSSGLEFVLTRLSWRSRIRMVIHLAGAPPHGSKYSSVLSSIHAVGADDYPNGDPYGKDPERVIATFATEGIDYLICKVSGGSPIESQGQMFSSPLYYPEVAHNLSPDSKHITGGLTKGSLLGSSTTSTLPPHGPPSSARSIPSPSAVSSSKYEHTRLSRCGPSVTNEVVSSKSTLVQNSIDSILEPMISSFSLTYELYRTLSKTSHSSFSTISVPYTASANDFAEMIIQYVRSAVMNQATTIDK